MIRGLLACFCYRKHHKQVMKMAVLIKIITKLLQHFQSFNEISFIKKIIGKLLWNPLFESLKNLNI